MWLMAKLCNNGMCYQLSISMWRGNGNKAANGINNGEMAK
jgi:hypothetical protein